MKDSQKSIRQQAQDFMNAHAVASLLDCATGSRVPQTGIYEVIHRGRHRESHEAVLISGNVFPACEGCGAAVQFRLLRSVPYIFRGGFRTEA
ncbi:MAG TPA: hypothetical protein VFU50_21080 [Terriglobales bacterium]|nr:hypothetical protein [Terriglobales bacterium]